MSLVGFAIRVATARALKKALPPAFEVLDSPQEPLDILDQADPKPLVAIYTGHSESNPLGRALLAGEVLTHLSLQFFLPAEVVFSYGSASIKIDTRRQGAETALDVIWRIAARALLAEGGDANPWPALWREFVIQTPRIINASYLVERRNVRMVAREVTIHCETLNEPVPGATPAGPWEKLIAAIEGDDGGDGLTQLAPWIAAEIRGGADLPQAERDRIFMGLSAYVAQASGIGGPIGDIDNDPAAPAGDQIPVADALAGDAPVVGIPVAGEG